MYNMNHLQQIVEPLVKYYFYRIHCKDVDVDDCYIGRTTRFEARISQHKMLSNDSDLKLYRCISQNGGFSNWICECIHTETCTDTAASFIEHSLFKCFEPSLNTRVPRVKLNVFKSPKIDLNRVACQSHYAIKTTCECGWIGSKMSLAHHLKSKKHNLFLEAKDLHQFVFGEMIVLDDTSALEEIVCKNCKCYSI